MKIALAQVNQTTGKIEENRDKIIELSEQAKDKNVDLIIFPEFSVVGGFCGDMLYNKDFLIANLKAMEWITSRVPVHTLCGVVTKDKFDEHYINAAALFYNDNMKVVAAKEYLNDSVFNDKKYFSTTGFSNVFEINGKNIACIIADSFESMQKSVEKASWMGVDIEVILNCSVYYKQKSKEVREYLKKLAKEYSLDIAYVNMTGASDGYVFNGGSCYVTKEGDFKAAGNEFKEEVVVFDTDGPSVEIKEENTDKEMYDALVLGLKDYCGKNGFKKCAIGISGGIDSALTLAIAADALGSKNILGVLMPSQYTSDESNKYALDICKRLNVETKIIPVKEIYETSVNVLTPFFDGREKDLTEENLQARIRCNIMMALSNKFGYVVLCTCNKSEDAVGYSTLYGDASGGYSVIGDLLKREVYALSNYRNTVSDVIPQEIIKRAPTAELRENQKDSDSLPEYDILDDIIEKILDKNMSYNEIIMSGIKKTDLDRVYKLLVSSEYKRRQTPVSTKVSKKSFVRDINLPMTNGYIWKPMEEKNNSQDTGKE